MSDINITKTIFVDAQPVTPVNKPSSDFDNASTAVNIPEQKPDAAPAYDNIVSVSDDGDTVQARPESYDRLSDGFVFNKTKEVTADNKQEDNKSKGPLNEERDIAAQEAEKNASAQEEEKEARIKEAIKDAQDKASEAKDILQDQIKEKESDDKAAERKAATEINYSSMSDSELERMYLTGQISSYAYNQEIESRKDREDNAKDENEDLSREGVAAQAGLEANENLTRNVTGENFGAGYETREEQDLVKEALYGKEMEDKNNSNATFEINLTK